MPGRLGPVDPGHLPVHRVEPVVHDIAPVHQDHVDAAGTGEFEDHAPVVDTQPEQAGMVAESDHVTVRQGTNGSNAAADPRHREGR